MSSVVLLSASPAGNSKTEALLEFIARRLSQYGHRTEFIKLRHLPAGPLLAGDSSDSLIASARATIAAADAVVVGSPVFKATYTGLLKVFVDLLPMDVLHGKPVLPVLTGGSVAHVLALDYGLKPLLATLGASSIGRGRFVSSSNILPATDTTPPSIDESVERDVIDAIDHFDSELTVRARSCPHAEAVDAEPLDPETLITAPTATERKPS
ncbi:FMN reductase (NADPH) [Brevibacterium permense]|uniref:NAD(P)H-dependent oxidoreductase n=1 Tax=Brevibacterium permense TaxID=234834 RepID=UPI0021D01871|nr:NAD(P)H-dependent oxidoreductase [Brevibacterium permense]MCU4295609.1 FMN reductase (NADPH) [Brevibacterium permense]